MFSVKLTTELKTWRIIKSNKESERIPKAKQTTNSTPSLRGVKVSKNQNKNEPRGQASQTKRERRWD